MAGENALDGSGREVLAVDPQPVVIATGEEEVALLVAIGEVSGPVDPVVDARLVGLVVLPVALEAGGAEAVDELADGLVGVEQAAVGVETRRRAFLGRLGVEHGHAVAAAAERAGRHVRRALHDRAALGGPVRVDDGDAEAAREAVDVEIGALVPEHEA